jgi:hypothetical protein
MEINELVEKLVTEKIEAIDFEAVVAGKVLSHFGYDVTSALKELAVKLVEKRASTIISAMIEEILAKEIVTNDGWGKTERFVSFEDLIRQTFATNLKGQYVVEKATKQIVEARISQLQKDVFDKAVKEIAEKMIESIKK